VNQIFGDMAVLTGSYFSTRVVALTDTKLLVLPEQEVERLVSENQNVRDQVLRRAVDCLRKIPVIHIKQGEFMRDQVELSTFKSSETVFSGIVDETTALIYVIIGSVEVIEEASNERKVLMANHLLCTEDIERSHCRPCITVRALEPTSVLIIQRSQLDFEVEEADHCRSLTKDDLEDMQMNMPGEVPIVRTTSGGDRRVTLSVPERERMPTKSVGSEWYIRTPKAAVREVEALASKLGWCESFKGDDEDERTKKGSIRIGLQGEVLDHILTDQEVQDHDTETRLAIQVAERERERDGIESRSNSKDSSSRQPEFMVNVGGDAVAELERQEEEDEDGHSSHAAIMVWLGILIDAFPESLIIGILINKSYVEKGNAAAGALPFVIGVFLSNLPESMGSAGSMKAHGMKMSTILLMWLAITVLTAFGAALGALLFPYNPNGDGSSGLIVAGVEGVAAGAMLTMIAQTMMPEAFEQGGDIVGLSCLAGFLSASCVRLLV